MALLSRMVGLAASFLVCMAIVSRDDHVLNFSATIALITMAGIFVPRSLWSSHVYSQHRKNDP